jgi:hypothetical protein
MSSSLTYYISKEEDAYQLALFIQRILSSMVFLSTLLLFIVVLKKKYDVASEHALTTFISKMIEYRYEQLYKELANFSVEVWQDEIVELQKTVKEMTYKAAIASENTIALCSQINAHSQEMAALKKCMMEEIEMLKTKKKKSNKVLI